jgi:hypothetical protein
VGINVIELLPYCSWPSNDISLHCLDDTESDCYSIYQIYSYICMAFGVVWGPHIYDCPGLLLPLLGLAYMYHIILDVTACRLTCITE